MKREGMIPILPDGWRVLLILFLVVSVLEGILIPTVLGHPLHQSPDAESDCPVCLLGTPLGRAIPGPGLTFPDRLQPLVSGIVTPEEVDSPALFPGYSSDDRGPPQFA